MNVGNSYGRFVGPQGRGLPRCLQGSGGAFLFVLIPPSVEITVPLCPIKKKKKKTKVKRPAARSAERALVPDVVPREDQCQVRRRRVMQSRGGS